MSSRSIGPARLTVAGAALGLLLGACTTDDPTQPVVSVTGVGVTAPAATVDVGATLQLQASVQPAGVAQTVSWSSSDPTRATVDAAGLVMGVQPGAVVISATSTADPSHTGTVQLTVTGCALLAPADVLNGAVLPPNTCYRADLPLSVNSGTLTVGAGVRIEFGPNAYLTINSNGRLNASGTAAAPIRFTSRDPVGSWRGIRFDGSRSVDNVLHHTRIENGGSSGWSGAAYSRSAVMLDGQSLVDIRNTTIAGSGGQGITVFDGSDMTFENNALIENAVAAWVHPNVVSDISPSTTFTNNVANVVRVAFVNTDRVAAAQTWQALSVPYEIRDRFFIEAALTIAPEAILQFTANAFAIVQDGGSLRAVGQANRPITFRSVEKDIVYWRGLQIRTAAADNVFSFVTFENGGSQAWTGAPDSRAMVYLDGNSKAVFTDSRFVGSDHYGLWVPGGGDISGFDRNTFVGNARAMIIHPNRVGGMTAGNSISGNQEDRVRVTYGNTDAVIAAQTWPALDAPYYITDRTFIQAALTIAPGAELEFAQNANFVVNNGGSLRADGTVAAPIAFRGGEDLTAYWKGIEYGTASAGNSMTNVTISNAGSQQWFGGANSTSSLYVTANGVASLTGVSFARSGGYAIIVGNGGVVACSAVNHGGFQFYDVKSTSTVSICP